MEKSIKSTFKDLKYCVGKIIALQELNLSNDENYLKINEQIDNTMKGLNENDINNLNKLLKEEHKYLLSIFQADLSDNIKKIIERDLEINEKCKKIVDNYYESLPIKYR